MSHLTGNRKMKGFYWTLIAIVLIVLVSILFSVRFSGDNIIAAITIIAAVGGAFFGANFGEHWAKAKQVNGLNNLNVQLKPKPDKQE